MRDLISRQAAMEEISKQQTYKMFEGEDTLYLDANDVGSVLASLPSAQSTMGQVFDGDTINRQAAIDAHYEYCNKHPDASFPVWSLKILEDLPPAQPETHEERTETHACDCISRQDAVEAIENIDWYHVNKDGQLTHGANSKEDEPLYKAEDVYKVLNDMPSAQPDSKELSFTQKKLDTISRQWLMECVNEGWTKFDTDV